MALAAEAHDRGGGNKRRVQLLLPKCRAAVVVMACALKLCGLTNWTGSSTCVRRAWNYCDENACYCLVDGGSMRTGVHGTGKQCCCCRGGSGRQDLQRLSGFIAVVRIYSGRQDLHQIWGEPLLYMI